MEDTSMPRDGFAVAPVEVILQIFEKSSRTSTTGAGALASTCKRLNDIWTAHGLRIMLPRVQESVVAFDEALLTIRVTKISNEYIIDSYNDWSENLMSNEQEKETTSAAAKQKRIPRPTPNTDLKTLGRQSTSANATLAELRSVYNLYILVSAAIKMGGSPVYRYANGTYSKHLENLRSLYPLPRASKTDLPYSILPTMEKAKNDRREYEIHVYRVYSSMYRVFLAGAYLAPYYWEPWFSDDEYLEDAMMRYVKHNLRSAETQSPLSSVEMKKPYFTSALFSSPPMNHRRKTESNKEETELMMTNEGKERFWRYPIYDFAEFAIKGDEVYKPLFDHLMDSGRETVLVDQETLHMDRINDMPERWIEDNYRDESGKHQFSMFFIAQGILRRLFANEGRKSSHQRIVLPTEKLASAFTDRTGQFSKYMSTDLIMFGMFQPERFYFPGNLSTVTANTWLLAGGTFKGRDGQYRRIIPDFRQVILNTRPKRRPNEPAIGTEVQFLHWAGQHAANKFSLSWGWFFTDSGTVDQGDYFFDGTIFWVMKEDYRQGLTVFGDSDGPGSCNII